MINLVCLHFFFLKLLCPNFFIFHFSQANLVIQDTVERIYLNSHTYGEEYRGVFIIRGENVVFLGELDTDKEDFIEEHVVEKTLEEIDLNGLDSRNLTAEPQVIRKIPFKDAERIFKEQMIKEEKILKEKSKKLNFTGVSSSNYENHLY